MRVRLGLGEADEKHVLEVRGGGGGRRSGGGGVWKSAGQEVGVRTVYRGTEEFMRGAPPQFFLSLL